MFCVVTMRVNICVSIPTRPISVSCFNFDGNIDSGSRQPGRVDEYKWGPGGYPIISRFVISGSDG